jgi:hypothetical protein
MNGRFLLDTNIIIKKRLLFSKVEIRKDDEKWHIKKE